MATTPFPPPLIQPELLPLNLVIRFPSSLPDLPLKIVNPHLTTALELNLLIRPFLPSSLRASRLRLIYSGRVLVPGSSSLATLLRLASPAAAPPPPPPPPLAAEAKGKGKAPILPLRPPLYIHASLSDPPLTEEELESEASAAADAAAALLTPSSARGGGGGSAVDPAHGSNSSSGGGSGGGSSSATAPPAPIGFDRLLAAGLTPVEVASLRSQFLAIQAHTHTPDTMPSGAEMRLLEDRWLDDGGNGAPAGAAGRDGGGGEGGAGALDEGQARGLDDMLWGNVIGFFWPVGSIVWGLREEGVWSKRRQIAVVTGVLVNLAFCVLR